MNDNVDYTYLYLTHKIKFRDIPLSKLNFKILKNAAKLDTKDYIDVIFKLYEIDNTIDLLSFARLISSENREYYEMYERIFDIDPEKYIYLIPDKCKSFRMWNVIFEINPEKYFSIIPSEYISSSMYETLLEINFDKYFDSIVIRKVHPELCQYIYQVHPEKLFKFVALTGGDNLYWNNLLTKDMCLKLVEIDLEKFLRDANQKYINMVFDTDPIRYFEIIPENKIDLHICNVMFEIDVEKYFLRIPMKFRTSYMCDKMFKLNPEKYFLEFPMDYRDLSKCRAMFKKDSEKYFTHFPQNCRIKTMCDKMFELNPEKYFLEIPVKHRTQDKCDKMLEINFEKYFSEVPHKFLKREDWLKMFKLNPNYVLNQLPKEFYNQEMYLEFYRINPKITFENMFYMWRTQEMCNEYFKLNRDSFEKYIPSNMFTREMYVEVLKRKFIQYSNRIPDSMIDVEIISIAKVEVDKLIQNGQFVQRKDLSKLMRMVIKLYPECKKLIFIDLEEKIRNDLYSLIDNGGTLEGISENYGVSLTVVNNILEKIKDEDLSNYNAIKNVLNSNQRSYFFNIMNDVKNLSRIINMIGNVDFKGMTLEQKLMFSYLCNKHVLHRLEEIYSFNFSKYTQEDYSNVTRFFNRVLKYNFICSENVTIPEKKTIQFNNGWIREYNRDRFFAIKNGKATIERKYGKDGEILTFEIEEMIINVLKSEGIPLNEVIVTTAFKEYFNGNLALYIEKFKEYDALYEDDRKINFGKDK